jgi:hypothetical protein
VVQATLAALRIASPARDRPERPAF